MVNCLFTSGNSFFFNKSLNHQNSSISLLFRACTPSFYPQKYENIFFTTQLRKVKFVLPVLYHSTIITVIIKIIIRSQKITKKKFTENSLHFPFLLIFIIVYYTVFFVHCLENNMIKRLYNNIFFGVII